MDSEEPTFTFPAAEGSVRAARKSVRGAMEGWGIGGELSETAELLVSELVTNAVLHAAGSPSCHVTCTRTASAFTVTVVDHGSGLPAVRDAGPGATSGRELLLVESLADDWGVRVLPRGKAAYFVLSVPPPPDGVPSAGGPALWRSRVTDRSEPTPGTTPGLRVPLVRGEPAAYVLLFGPHGERREALTTAQLMSLVVDAAGELGFVLSAPPRDS